MNLERIAMVRDLIASQVYGFTMTSYSGRSSLEAFSPLMLRVNHLTEANCGTACCIGGHACLLAGGPTPCGYAARHWLGLSPVEAEALFLGHNLIDGEFTDDYDHGGLDLLTRDQAIWVLDHLIATGNIDWTTAREMVPVPAE